MSELTLTSAQTIITAGLAEARAKKMKPLGIAVLDARGALKAYGAEEGTSLARAAIAEGKAYGALGMGLGSRTIAKMAAERPHFIAAATHAVRKLIPVAGGVLIKDQAGKILGAVGVSGDISDNDEIAALAGIKAAKLIGDPGSD
jgi:uncharacterized protein GlcG (DUF336 family)